MNVRSLCLVLLCVMSVSLRLIPITVHAQDVTTLASTELIDFAYRMGSGDITTWITLMLGQNITLFIARIAAFSYRSSGYDPSTEIAKIKQLITAANAAGIDVAVDLHTWTTTWSQDFDDSSSSETTRRALYIDFVEEVIVEFGSANVHSWMVLNEPNAWPASPSENTFILNVLSAADALTSKPVSVRFQGGNSPSTGHYSVSIDAACDVICRNTYWDPRDPDDEVYSCSEDDLLDARDYAHAHSKEFWVTEFGTIGGWTSGEENQRSHAEAFVTWANLMDVDKIFAWVCEPEDTTNPSEDENYNLLDPGGYTPRPAFYMLVNPEEAEPPAAPPNTVQLVYPLHLQTRTVLLVTFYYYPVFYQAMANASLWLNITGTWQRVGWNTTVITNNTANTLAYTFAGDGVYVWNVQVFNSTDAHWAPVNYTLTIDTSGPPADDPPAYGAVSVSTTVAGQEARFACAWSDDVMLSYGILSHNVSGAWANATAVGIFAPYDTLDTLVTLPASLNVTVGYRFYANDSASQWNSTGIYTFITESATGYGLFFNGTVSLGFMCGVDEYGTVTVLSGTWASQDISAVVGSLVGWLQFVPSANASIRVDFTNLHVWVDDERITSGDTFTVVEDQVMIIAWRAGIVELLPIMFIFGMVGLGAMFGGVLYPIHIIREDHDYRKAFIAFVTYFFIGFGLFISWVFL